MTSGSSPVSLYKKYINSRPTKRSYNNAQERPFDQPLLCTDPSFSTVAFLLFPLSIDALSAASLLRRSPLSSIALLSSPSLSPQPLISTSTSSLLRRSPLSLPLFVTILFPLFFSVSLLLRLAVHRSPSPSFSYSVVLILCALSVGLLLRCSFLQPSPPPLSLCCAFLHRFLTSLSLLRSYPPSFSLHRWSPPSLTLRRFSPPPIFLSSILPSEAPLCRSPPHSRMSLSSTQKTKVLSPPPKKTQPSKTNQINQSRPC